MGKKYRPINQRLLCFRVLESRYSGSMIYKANIDKGVLRFKNIPIWIISAANDCKGTYEMGEKYGVADGFELESINIDLRHYLEDHPAFEKLRKYVEETDGKVLTHIVHENSLEFQDEEV